MRRLHPDAPLLMQMSFEAFDRFQAAAPHTEVAASRFDRYSDTVPYEETRVCVPGVDYINASHLKYGASRFVACQSPLPSTVGHFWHMVWHHRLVTIVMLVQEERRRSEPYWPSTDLCFGPIKVRLAAQTACGPFVRRDFVVESTGEGSPLNVTHWQYMEWPDHGAPEDSADITAFIRRSIAAGFQDVVVHCSAGVGRTGSFCTLWAALENAPHCSSHEHKLAFLAEVIGTFKHQRNRQYCVETPEQYAFILQALQ